MRKISYPGSGLVPAVLLLLLLSGVSSAAAVSSCSVIGASGSYSLTQNLSGAPINLSTELGLDTATCIYVNVSNVVLDCAGFNVTDNGTRSIYANGSAGVSMLSRSNVTIKNCPGINNYSLGLVTVASGGNFFYNNTFYNNSQFGVLLYSGSNRNAIENSTAMGNTFGFSVGADASSNFNNLTNNRAYNNSQAGFQIAGGSENNSLVNNSASGNIDTGIKVSSSNYNRIINNTAMNNTDGIALGGGSNYNNVTGNRAYNNSNAGISLSSGSRSNNVINNNASGNSNPNPAASANGILITNSDGTNVTGNDASNTYGQYAIGISVSGSNWTIIANNIANNNNGSALDSRGIYLRSCNYSTVTGNTVRNNSQYGIELDAGSLYNNISGNNANANYQGGIFLYLGSHYNNVVGNNVSGGTYNYSIGISLVLVNYSNITGNIATNNSGRGIYLEASSGNLILNNNVSANIAPVPAQSTDGITMQGGSNGNNITGNDASNNVGAYSVGIHITESHYNTIANNIANNNNGSANDSRGIYLRSCNYSTVTGNTVRNNSQYGIELDAGSYFNNIIANNASGNYKAGIRLSNSSNYNTIDSNNASFSTATVSYGIDISYSNYSNVTNNIAKNNTICGIALSGAWFNNIIRNNATGSRPYDANSFSANGIQVQNNSNYNNVNGNDVSNGSGAYPTGIYVIESHYNTISNNTASNITGNWSVGIYLGSSNYSNLTGNTMRADNGGIKLAEGSSFNNVFNNTAMVTDGFSITNGSNSNNFTDNTANYNGRWGFLVDSSRLNNIAGNTARENGQQDLHIDARNISYCDNVIERLTSSGGRPINYTNATVAWSNLEVAEMVLCNANGSTLTNITIHGSDTYLNNDLVLVLTGFITVRDSVSSDNYYGFKLVNSNGNNFTNIIATNNQWGVLLENNSAANTLTNCTLVRNVQGGVKITFSNYTAIRNANVSDNPYGVAIYDSYITMLDNVSAANNSIGVLINHSAYFNITNSRFINGTGTVVNPPNTSNIFVYNSANIAMENVSFVNGSSYAMVFWNSARAFAKNLTIINCTNSITTPYSDAATIYFYANVSFITITDSRFSYNPAGGIGLTSSNITYCVINNSLFNNNGFATVNFAGADIPVSGHVNITNNTFINNFAGAFLGGGYNIVADNNFTNNILIGLLLTDFSYYDTLRNNTIRGTPLGFVLSGDFETGQNISPIKHYTEHDIDTGNTVDGKPIYYYSNFMGNVPAPGWYETHTDGAMYVCSDCIGVTFENLTVHSNVSHGVYIYNSTRVTTRNDSTSALYGIAYTLTNNSVSYNNSFYPFDVNSSLYGLLLSSFQMPEFFALHSYNITLRDSRMRYGLQGIISRFSSNLTIRNITMSDFLLPLAVFFENTDNSTMENISMNNLTKSGSYSNLSVFAIGNSTRNSFVNINVTNVVTDAYYYSYDNSTNTMLTSRFENTVVSFAEHDVALSPTSSLPSLPSPGMAAVKYGNISNTSADSYINLTIHYTASDLPSGALESTLKIWKYSGGSWHDGDFATNFTLNMAAKTVSAYNITNFSSTFAALVTLGSTPVCTTCECLGTCSSGSKSMTLSATQSCSPESVRIRATDPGGNPLEDASISMGANFLGKTDSSGIFTFVPERKDQSVFFYGTKSGYSLREYAFTLAKCIPLYITAANKENPDGILLTVTDDTGAKISGADVKVTAKDGTVLFEGITNSLGELLFTPSVLNPPGLDVTVAVSKAGAYIPTRRDAFLPKLPSEKCLNSCTSDQTQNPYPDCVCVKTPVEPPKKPPAKECSVAPGTQDCSEWSECVPISAGSKDGIQSRRCVDSCALELYGTENVTSDRRNCVVAVTKPPGQPPGKTLLDEVSTLVSDVIGGKNPAGIIAVIVLVMVVLVYLYLRTRQAPRNPLEKRK